MASNWPLRGMKRTLWDGGLRGVAFASGAGLLKTGYVSSMLLHVTDWHASLLSLAANGLGVRPDDASGWVAWHEHPTLRQWLADRHEPPYVLGDGIDQWRAIATGEAGQRTEVLFEAHPPTAEGANLDDGNGQALRVGRFKLIVEKGPQWHGPPNDLWYESGSNPSQYAHTVDCGGPLPSANATDYCSSLPCLFDLSQDPCEYHDLSTALPGKVEELMSRLADFQATAVPMGFHKLNGTGCVDPDPAEHPEWNGSWMPFCKGVATFEV